MASTPAGNVTVATLTLDGPDLDTTDSTLTANDTVNANAGTLAFNNALTTSTLNVAGGTVEAGNTVAATDLNVSDGTLNAANTLAATSLTVSDGTLNAADDVTVTADATVTGGGLNLLGGSTLTADTVEVLGGTVNTGTGSVLVRDLKIAGNGFVTNLGKITAEGSDLLAGVDITVTEPLSTLSLTGVSGAAPPGAVGAWTFDDVSGDTVFDAGAGTPADGTLMNGATIVAGNIGNALLLDGSNQYVDMGNPTKLDFGSGDFTLAMWVNTTSADKSAPLGNGGDQSGGKRYSLGIDERGGDGRVTLTMDDDVDKRQSTSDARVHDGNWHHIVGMRKGTALLVYVDGVEDVGDQFNDVAADYSPDTSQANFYLGNTWDQEGGQLDSKWFEGMINDVFVIDRALTPEEVSELWNNGDGVLYVAGLLDASQANLTIAADSIVDIEGTIAKVGGLELVGGKTATLSGAPDVTIGRLGGDGTVVGDLAAGTLAPGVGVGTLSVEGTLNLEADSIYEWELASIPDPGFEGTPGTDWDLAAVTIGDLVVADGMTLTLLDATGMVKGDPYVDVPPSAKLVVFTYDTLTGNPDNWEIDTLTVDNWDSDPITGATLEAVGNQVLLKGLTRVNPPTPAKWWVDGDGLYSEVANWSDGLLYGIPNAVDAEVNFLGKITAPREVTVDLAVTVGTINFKNSNSYTVKGPQAITLATSVGDPQIIVLAGNHTISAPLSAPDGLAVETASETSLTLTQSGTLAAALTKTGAGTLVVGALTSLYGAVTVNAGTLSTGPGSLAPPPGLTAGPLTIGNATVGVAGSVPRQIELAVGADPYTATIRATGNLTLGDQGSNGYDFAGTLDVADHPLTVLGPPGTPLVHYVKMNGGTLTGSPELHVAPLTGFIDGTGEVSGTVRAGDPSGDAFFRGVGPGQELVVSGMITGGITDLGNVNFSGTPRPGFSAKFTPTGSNSKWAETVFEIGGAAETEVLYDPVNGDSIVMGDYSQWYCFGTLEDQPAGPPTTFSKPKLILDSDTTFQWDQLVAGDELKLIVTGVANIQAGPFIFHYQEGSIEYGPDLDTFKNALQGELDLITLADGLDWDTPLWRGATERQSDSRAGHPGDVDRRRAGPVVAVVAAERGRVGMKWVHILPNPRKFFQKISARANRSSGPWPSL